MSFCMSRLIGTSLVSAHPNLSSTSFAVTPIAHTSISKNKDLSLCNIPGLSSRCVQNGPPRRKFAVCSNITPPPGVPLPSGPPSGSMKSWVLGIVLTFVLPFITHKWGPLIVLKNKVDTVVDMAEHIAEVIEDVAEKVDGVIDNITDDLPDNSELKKTLKALDALVEGVAKTAHIANDIIDKVEEAEDKLESLILSDAREGKVSKQVAEKMEVSTIESNALKIE
ncbi:hypothetical protein LXL04_039120 [Taraxacum kok-saghyz]